MVCFSRSVYILDSTSRLLLSKYLEGIYVKVKYPKSESVFKEGYINSTFFDNVDDEYIIETQSFWNGHIISQILPKWIQPHKSNDVTTAVINASEKIDQFIEIRMNNEIFVSIEFNEHLSKGQIFTLMGLIKNTKNITRWLYSSKEDRILLLLNNKEAIEITLKKVCDTSLSFLDFDEGFVQNSFGSAFLCDEMHEQWKEWSKLLKETEGKSWNEPILVSKY